MFPVYCLLKWTACDFYFIAEKGERMSVISKTHHLIPELEAFAPALIIFDKDGTLIDFDAMWGGWMIEVAWRLEAAAGLPITGRLFHVLGFDPDSSQVAPDGPLAIAPMADLRAVIADVLCQIGLSPQASEAAVAAAWHVPDPVALASPLADLPALFTTLRDREVKIAIATTDDRAPTEATLTGLGVASFVDALVCGDDGMPVKPAPDMVWTICRVTGVLPEQAVVVGDTVADLQMGRAAGAGLVLGVLSGVGSVATLAPHADLLLARVSGLIEGGS
jgi:phosphoglycolate phosphatase-like HAD superfamily hydrolase